mmetsp:Transcript_2926/g.5423  ORF Transcript_2926/g.5423 Transcript_2926/m.5423 type:complete len:149 (+) Transcript_2926:108-554(+)
MPNVSHIVLQNSHVYVIFQYDLKPSFRMLLCHSSGNRLCFDKIRFALEGDAFRKLLSTCLLIFPRLQASTNTASANWSRIAPFLRCLEMTRKKFVNDDTHGSNSFESKRAWKQDRATPNASFLSSSVPCVYAHAFIIVEYVIRLGPAS